MEEAIRDLLDGLEAAEAAGASLTDSVIADALHDVIQRGFVAQEPGYRVPKDLLLNYTEECEQQNAAVVAALGRFLERARAEAKSAGLDTPDEREAAFRDSEAESSSGDSNVASYFDRD